MSRDLYPAFLVFAGSRQKALAWLDARGLDPERHSIDLIVHADELGACAAGAVLDLTGLFPASGPLRRAIAARRDRFAFFTEGEFLAEIRRRG